MKVLISAYSCGPGRGSEPGAGWAWAKAAARDHQVWLMTHATNRPLIAPELAADPALAARIRPVYLQNPAWARRLRRRGPLRFCYYVLWQVWTCRRAATRLHTRIGFDVAHHVTYASDWMPAGVGWVRGLRHVWGPVGGASTIGGPRLWIRLGPRTALSELLRAALLVPLRRVVGRTQARRAALVLGQNEDVARALRPVPVMVEPHVAVEDDVPLRSAAAPGRPPTAVAAARLLGWKGIRLALAALRSPAAARWRFDVYGDGAERAGLTRLAVRWGLDDRVRFLGNRPRSEVRDALSRADVLLLPSIHDAGGWSVAEAMNAGCPVVGLRLGGPATLVGAGDGVLVDPRGDVVGGLARALDDALAMTPSGTRWRANRLPDLVSDIYRRCVEAPGSAASTGLRGAVEQAGHR